MNKSLKFKALVSILMGAIVLLIGLSACNKKQNTEKGNLQLELNSIEDSTVNYCRRGLVYDGYNGKIDSIIVEEYKLKGGKEALYTSSRKYFDHMGYVGGEEQRTYENGELISVTHTAYTRDADSFVTIEQTTSLTSMGSGYTKQYSIVDRNNNLETWEYLRKMPGEDIKLSAEDRKYNRDEMKIYDQVGNTMEMILFAVYKPEFD